MWAFCWTRRKSPSTFEIAAVCKILGFDPLYIANESKLGTMVAHEDAESVLKIMRATKYGEGAVIIGEVTAEPRERVLLKTPLGNTRIVDILAGKILPRIC
jgi:hydrogenase expression/formation protein HypE